MGDLIPGAKLIYERVDDSVYARYRDAPHNKIPRWLVESNRQPDIFEYQDFEDCKHYANQYPILKKQLDRLKTIWYTIKDEAEKKITAE